MLTTVGYNQQLFVSYWFLRQLIFVIALKRKNALFWEGRKTDQETKRNKKNIFLCRKP